jgi:hypothetical protein
MRRGHGDKFSRKREAAIAALLKSATLKSAAAEIGFNEKTLDRWMKDPGFIREYREVRRRIVEHAVALTQMASAGAVRTLVKGLRAKKESDRIRAAMALFDRAVAAMQLADVETVEQATAVLADSQREQREPSVNGAIP